MDPRRAATWFVVAAVVVSTGAAWGGPYEIRRVDGDASRVGTAPVYATVSFGPFEDDAGTLTDPRLYFYTVDDVVGTPLQLSVTKNVFLGTVRLGFDDGLPASADVDAALSSVTVQPAAIPADGTTVATVVVVPRDGAGMPLGSGLTVAIDPNLLLPGLPAGFFVDHGNGEYTLPVISWSEGVGQVVVSVEGRILDDQPALLFEPAEPGGSPLGLSDLIETLQTVIDDAPFESYSHELELAIKDLEKAVDALDPTSPDLEDAAHRILKSIEDIERAVLDGLDAVEGNGYMQRLAELSRELAVIAIDIATAAGGDPTDALAELDAGDADAATGAWADAARHYELATRLARQSA